MATPISAKVALDLDGTVVGCIEACLDLYLADCGPEAVTSWHGMPAAISEYQPPEIDHPRSLAWSARWGKLPSEIAEITGQLHLFPHKWPGATRTDVTSEQLWGAVAAMGERFWDGLELLPWAPELIDLVERAVGVENVILVTAPQPNAESWSGKYRWIARHLPQHLDRVYMCKDKALLARGSMLLIDDGPHNVKAWRGEYAPAVLWPMPWNAGGGPTAYTDPDQALGAVRRELGKLTANVAAARKITAVVDECFPGLTKLLTPG